MEMYMKEQKTAAVSVRINEMQSAYIDRIVSEKGLKNRSAAIQYILNNLIIKGM